MGQDVHAPRRGFAGNPARMGEAFGRTFGGEGRAEGAFPGGAAGPNSCDIVVFAGSCLRHLVIVRYRGGGHFYWGAGVAGWGAWGDGFQEIQLQLIRTGRGNSG